MLNGTKVYLGPVEEENIEQLRMWRNQPQLRKYFREFREINKKMQSQWFMNKVVKDPNQVNFKFTILNVKS